jgi:hypothetical protein
MKELRNWSLGVAEPHHPPEWCRFEGQVYNHPRFTDGEYICPSQFVAIDPDTELVRTYSGSIYKICDPAPEYEKAFPNARQRTLENCKRRLKHEFIIGE